MTYETDINCELVVIGAGMAGMAATLFAANRGLKTLQVGIASEIIFASGLLDLLGVHPMETGKIWENPWQGLKVLSRDLPNHPYAKIALPDIHDAFEELTTYLGDIGLPYRRHQNRNARLLTSVGTIKATYYVPQSMWNGVIAFEEKQPCLILGIDGLRGFSARQVAETLKNVWSGIDYARIAFPETEHLSEVYTEPLARSLALPETRQALAARIKPLVKDAHVVGLPAVFGMYETAKVQSDLEERLGVALFEIPTMPPSIPGLRLKDAFEQNLPEKNIRLLYQKKVLNVRQEHKDFVLEIGDSVTEYTARTKGIILASGRFLGKGLYADRKRIREALFDLPVYQPAKRPEWHRFEFLNPEGHPINQAGLETDAVFRPLDHDGRPAFENLFAVGSILAHQDWMRMKCGAGLAIATAYAAVNAFLEKEK